MSAATGQSPQPNQAGLTERLYGLAIGEDEARLCRDIPDSQCSLQPGNFLRQVVSQALSKTGDVLADPKVVLPWLIGAVGAPAFVIGLLVPIRESLALLPQILVGGYIRRFAVRKGFWAVSSLVEGAAIALIGLAALTGLEGAAAGWTIVVLLTIFSLARGVASIAAKDTLGKTVSKGQRGRVSGYAATASGLVAAGVGLYLVLSPDAARPEWLLYVLLLAAGVSWGLAALVYWTIDEVPGATDGGRGIKDLIADQSALLLKDRELQKFLLARTLMISTALFGPVYSSLALREAGGALSGLGWLLLATALASVSTSAIWGRLADRSSRLTMSLAALLAGLLGLLVLAALNLAPELRQSIYFYAVVLYVLGVSHAGVRIGRKTHIVDLAGGDRKADYVALSNTLIGLLLLAIGGLTGLLLGFGLEIGIAVLAVLALAGAAMAMALKNVQA